MSRFAPDVLRRWRTRLERELEELNLLLQQTASDSAAVELDQQSFGRLARMDAMRMQALAQETQRRRLERRPRLEAALKRVDEGEFGFCTRCGEAISERRLEIDPTYLVCIDCAR